MIHAYDPSYLDKAQTALGRMLEFAVVDLHMELAAFWERFLHSPLSGKFERGDSSVLAGMSGVEMVYEVLGRPADVPPPHLSLDRSPEYWTGWALAYFQWETGLRFRQIQEFISVEEVRLLYHPYHEMDLRQFCDRLRELYRSRHDETNLKRLRRQAGLTQAALAACSEIPVRTIQQYEQGQKSINSANAEYVVRLARTLCCQPEELLELS